MSQVFVAVATNPADVKEVKLVSLLNAALVKADEASEKLANYIADRTAAELASKVEINDTVQFTYGRAETKKELEGKVLAVIDTGTGKLLKVLAGVSADMKVYDVRAKDATVVSPERVTAAEVVATNAVQEQTAEASQEVAQEAAAGESVDVDALIARL